MTTTRGTRRAVLVALLALAAIVVPWAGTAARDATPQPAAEPSGPRELILATTTSTQDTGLLDDLIPMFEQASGYRVKTIAVGSGQAMALGQRGEADVLLVHSPAAEAKFMADGYGTDRRTVMYNDFVLIGPASDPAGIKGGASATAAMAKVAAAQAPFVSRGDDSGTNALELKLWKAAGVTPGGSWYTESGTGMGDTLNIANERQAYTISDRGTYLSMRDRLELPIMVEGDKALLNVYHVVTVNPANGQGINTAVAVAFRDFLLDPATQREIGAFGTERFGQPLFTPCADNACGVEAAPGATPAAATPAA